MKTIKVPYASFGTLYGTVNAYDTIGNIIGPQNITGYGIFFSVKTIFDPNGVVLFEKSIGTGITITTGTLGLFTVTFSSSDLNRPPKEYVYGCWINPVGTVFSAGTTNLKSIGSGIFEIMQGVKYGTI